MDADPWDLDELASKSARHHQEFASMVKVEPNDASEVNEDDVKILLKVKDELIDQIFDQMCRCLILDQTFFFNANFRES